MIRFGGKLDGKLFDGGLSDRVFLLEIGVENLGENVECLIGLEDWEMRYICLYLVVLILKLVSKKTTQYPVEMPGL